MKKIRIATLFVALLVMLTACKGTARLKTETSQRAGTLTVTVTVEPPTSGKLHFKGNDALEKLGSVEVKSDGKAEANVPLAGAPLGENKVTMTFEGVGRGLAKTVSAKGDFTFDNTPSQSLKLRAGAAATGTSITCKGGTLCSDDDKFPVSADGKMNVDLSGCDGCTVEVGGQKIQVHDPQTNATIDLTNALGDALNADFVKLPFKITGRDGQSANTTLDTNTVPSAIIFGLVTRGPLHFAGETAHGVAHSAIIINADSALGIISRVGTAEHMRDFDLVGVSTSTEKTVGKCAYVKPSDPTKTQIMIDHVYDMRDITVYDRRLGTKVGHRSFQPSDTSCNGTLNSTATSTMNFVNPDQVDPWVKTLLK